MDNNISTTEYITVQRVEREIPAEYDSIMHYSWSIVLIGMLVIFSSLSLTGLVISQLQNLSLFSKLSRLFTRRKMIPKLKDNKSRDTGIDAVIAAVTALHYHIQEAEESNKMIIAWTREPVSVWKASARFLMPNRIMRERKR